MQKEEEEEEEEGWSMEEEDKDRVKWAGGSGWTGGTQEGLHCKTLSCEENWKHSMPPGRED